MKCNSIALAALAFIAGSVIAAPANIESRDIPLLGGHSGPLQGLGETLDSIEKLVPGLGQ
ncbi:uncharacterized protein G6M90_00g036680 [Metarhizium brunneum]|uniref:Uncharacterized protein n=1 Tax=Metarhizium brunneum TaxID=500148 RepID=A0A7D5UVB7_9HYPO